jgi:hypothetical protein
MTDTVYDATEILWPFINNVINKNNDTLKNTHSYKYFAKCALTNAKFRLDAVKLELLCIHNNYPGVICDMPYIYFENFSTMFIRLQELLNDSHVIVFNRAILKMADHIKMMDLEDSLNEISL